MKERLNKFFWYVISYLKYPFINKIDTEGFTPLLFSIAYNHVIDALALISRGADVNRAGKDGYTPLHFAVLFNHPDIAETLINHGANENAATVGGETPRQWAAQFGLLTPINQTVEKKKRNQQCR